MILGGHCLEKELDERFRGLVGTIKDDSLAEHSVDLDSNNSRSLFGVYHVQFLHCSSIYLISSLCLPSPLL